MSQTASASPALKPLRRPVFRALWLALIVSSLGSWMHDVGAGWLMTTLAPDPVMVSLVQFSMMLPVFFLTLPAGALADIVDRRRYLLFTLTWLMCVALLLGVLTLSGITTAWTLLVLTFSMGIGMALMAPAFAALIPDLVPREELTAAITLNSIAFNATRAIGPAIAGSIVALTGSGIVFLINAISYSAVIFVLFKWRNEQPASNLPSERFTGAIRSGIRYVRRSRALHVILIRGVAVFAMISAPMAFLPLVVKTELNAGPEIFGLLLGCVGIGAVAAGLTLARVRSRVSADRVILTGSLGVVLATLALAYVRNIAILAPAMLVLGGAWITAMSTLQVSAQLSLPAWVRARGLAVFIATFMGIMAIGAVSWGQLAALTSLTEALTAAAAFGVLGIVLTWRLSISKVVPDDEALTPAYAVGDTVVPTSREGDRGPVLVNIEYQIDDREADAFSDAMQSVRKIRLRNGSTAWGLFQDTRDEHRFVEVFVDESWVEHLRQRYRVTREDRHAIDTALAFHRGTEPPKISHLLSKRRTRRGRNAAFASGYDHPVSGVTGDQESE
jgi:MFS family permease